MNIENISVEGPGRPYRLSYVAFGSPAAGRTIICVHGLTRNARDFDRLAETLAEDARVICPDVVGRGASEWLDEPADYAVPTYVGHMLQLIRHLDAGVVDWVGTSMGGLIGMAIASMEQSPIRKLVLNDVGPFIPKEALQRIGSYLGTEQCFADLAALEAHLRLIHAPFGPLSDEQWAHLARHSAKPLPQGGMVLSYDPKIAAPFKEGPAEDADMWQIWDSIACPTLVLRGAASDLLLKKTAIAMTQRGPRAELVEFGGIGHAPALMAEDQIRTVRTWLDA